MRILLAEDEASTADYIASSLRELGHTVVVAGAGDAALERGRTESFDVAVLDRMLPELDGLEVLRRWRLAGIGTPVLMLTALGGIADRVAGLEAGADDYLVKPFAIAELAARLGALTRRQGAGETAMRLSAGDIVVDLIAREVTRAGVPILLQPREFAILELLVRNAGKVVTRTMFLETIWGYHFDPHTNIVESHLSRMRAKLNEKAARDPIETLRGIGYRLNADG